MEDVNLREIYQEQQQAVIKELPIITIKIIPDLMPDQPEARQDVSDA
jgi:hypothetical protein